MEILTQILGWVLASVVASLLAGFYIGRTKTHSEQQRQAQKDRETALQSLVGVLKSVQDLSTDVGHRNTEMNEVRRHVDDIRVTGEMEVMRQDLLGQVLTILASNQKMEEDLTFARCRMEQQAEELDRTRREAHTDALSGVANRKAFDDRLRLMLAYHRRDGVPFVLMLSDLDHFKWINDTYGHQAGDRVIKQLGALLVQLVREGDFVARLGGDEFAVLLPHCDLDSAMDVASRLCSEATRTNFGVATTEATAITVSAGLAIVQPGDTGESLFERADAALYASKNGGRNQFRCQEQTPQNAPPTPQAAAIGQAQLPAPPVVLTAEHLGPAAATNLIGFDAPSR